jgi:hypothetical protein
MSYYSALRRDECHGWRRRISRGGRRGGASHTGGVLLHLLLLSPLTTTTSSSTSFANAKVLKNPPPVDDVINIATRLLAYYGPRNYNDMSGLSRPENIDYTKISRVMYGPYRINDAGSIWGTDSNADSQLLFGPTDWNPNDPENAPEYCHFDSPDNDMKDCGHHFYSMGLLGMAHANGVEVYPTIGGMGYGAEFSKMASDPKARMKVSWVDRVDGHVYNTSRLLFVVVLVVG